MNEYFQTDQPQNSGLPYVGYSAENFNPSANYFRDLVKKESGKTPQEHIHQKLIEITKDKIFDIEKSVKEIAFELGFKYQQHYSSIFKKSTGYTHNETGLKINLRISEIKYSLTGCNFCPFGVLKKSESESESESARTNNILNNPLTFQLQL